MTKAYKAGFVAIVGAPNAGKSTFLNHVLGEKIAAVTSKPQTTRHRILGVLTEEEAQLVFWDTPGLHEAKQGLLNQEMVNRALGALEDSDLTLWVVDADRRGREHKTALEIVAGVKNRPLVVAVNKVDAVPDKAQLLPLIQEIQEQVSPVVIVPISARTGDGVRAVLDELIRLLPENPPFYPEDTLTDQPERVIAAEMVREAVFKLTSQEIPYSTAVTIDEFKEEAALVSIAATIHVEKESQKGVIIGKGGSMLKKIGQTSRVNIERLLGVKVFLKLFVRTTRDWSKKKSTLLEFGYGD
ncbi:GTPase Era [Deltaproteobacteria bacterium OttesenSCG-928-K17]|nr:GTPase Era [Deltaproteobacteria bacterium OttesenSCG-928-K17]